MIALRRSQERGRTRLDWLDSYHTFSFGDYHDPRQVQFRDLRVINEDRVDPETGFGTHPHRDSMGSGSVLTPGEIQIMSAGTGITHSEFNASRQDPVHLLQIWILPERKGITPRYEQRWFPEAQRRGRLQAVVSSDGRDGSLVIHQDVTLHLGSLGEGDQASLTLAPGRHAWVQVARGAISLNGTPLQQGDGAAVSDERELVVRSSEDSEILLFDLR